MKKITIINNNKTNIIYANRGDNLLELLREHHYYIEASCGGNKTCKKCKVKYLNQDILACSTSINDDMIIDLGNNFQQMINDSLVNNYERISQIGYGIALDLGTTTIVFYLLNLKTGIIIDQISELNKQASYGADVITRINQAKVGNLDKLNQIIITQINDIIEYFENKHQITIEKIVVSANTTMLHLLACVDPSFMGVAPYTPVFLENKHYLGKEIKLNTKDVIFLPSISAFLGSDIVSGITALRLDEEKGNILFIDLGTNGEIILKNDNQFYGTSTAAGPAFEGGNIECGIGGVNDAITKVSFDKELYFNATTNEPKGICGSGLVDLISILVNENIIDQTGRFNLSSNSILSKYLINDKFYLTESIYLSQKDIREFQLAKSAIYSGIMTLLDYVNLDIKMISKVYLAGGFGFYLHHENALRVGLLPKFLNEKIISGGNTSGLGAKIVLLNPSVISKCEEIAKKVKVVELTNNPTFYKYFIDSMSF